VEQAPLAELKQPPVTQSVLSASSQEQPPSGPPPLSLKSVLPLTNTNASHDHFVQLGARETKADAQSLARELEIEEQGLANARIETRESKGVWRVLSGPYSETTAQSLCNDLDRPCAVISE